MPRIIKYDMKTIAGRLYHMRKEVLKIPQARVAEDLRIDRTTYIKYENGQVKPANSFLAYFAKTYNVSLPWLLDGVGPSRTDTDETIREGFAKQFSIEDITFLREYTMLPKKARALIDPALTKVLQCMLEIFQRSK